MIKRILLLFLVTAVICSAVWTVIHFKVSKRLATHQSTSEVLNLTNSNGADAWAEAVEKVKADRGEPPGAVLIPPELRHYSDRHWFLATQVAEVDKYKIQTCQDFVDLAGMIERGELVTVPAVTDSYV